MLASTYDSPYKLEPSTLVQLHMIWGSAVSSLSGVWGGALEALRLQVIFTTISMDFH